MGDAPIVRVNGVTFWGRPARLPFRGFAIEPGGYIGFRDSVPMRTTDAQRSTVGSFDVPPVPGVRLPSLKGWCTEESDQKLQLLGDRLAGLGADGGPLTVIVNDNGERYFLRARLDSGPTEFRPRGDTAMPVADYRLSLRCVDPRKYGPEISFGGAGTSTTVHQRGNFPAWPVHEVRGSMSGYSINGPDGHIFRVTLAISGDTVHTIDMSTGLLRVDGVITYGNVSIADTWAVPPGVRVTQTLVPFTGSGTLTTKVRKTRV